jgi:hypothetical protein
VTGPGSNGCLRDCRDCPAGQARLPWHSIRARESSVHLSPRTITSTTRLGEGLSIASGRKRPSVFDDDDAVDGSGYPTAVSTGAGAAERASALAARTCSVIHGYVRPMPSSRENRARQPNEYTRALLKFLDCTPTGPGM